MFLPRPDCSGGRRERRWSLFDRRPSGRFWRPNGVVAKASVVTGARTVANLLAAPALLARWWVVCHRQLAVGLAPRAPPHRSIGGPIRCSEPRICSGCRPGRVDRGIARTLLCAPPSSLAVPALLKPQARPQSRAEAAVVAALDRSVARWQRRVGVLPGQRSELKDRQASRLRPRSPLKKV